MKRLFTFIMYLLVVPVVWAQQLGDIEAQLKNIPGLTVEKIEARSSDRQAFKLSFLQPVDHHHPEGKWFSQKIYFSFVNDTAPVVMVTEGYQAPRNYLSEPAKLLNANQLIVEHRFFGESVPDSLDWTKMNTFQAASDHHRIREFFGEIFPDASWLASGISKGGQTTIYYRYYYPNDVAVSMPYVAPLNIEQEDPRINLFLRTVGTPECRAQLLHFQRLLLENEEKILPLLQKYKAHNGISFTQSDGLIFEFAVLEIPFTFWQWAPFTCESLKELKETPEALFLKMQEANVIDMFSEQSMNYFMPFFVQAYQEIGYYNYDTDSLKNDLKFVSKASNGVFLPDSLHLPFLAHQMEKVQHWVANEGNHFVYIYGELDPWISTSPTPDNRTNALKMVLPGGSHATRLKDFSHEQQKEALELIKRWLKENKTTRN